MSGSGWSHIRYDHKSRPKIVEVVCPSCGSRAIASKPSEEDRKGAIVADLSPTFRIEDWQIRCTGCAYRKSNLSYKDLPILYFSGGVLDLWAWNADHAECILSYLKGEDTSDNSYHWFMTYVRGDWKKSSSRIVKELDKMLNKRSHFDS